MDDRLHLGLTSKFLTPSTYKSFVGTVFNIIDQNNRALGILFFSKVGNLG